MFDKALIQKQMQLHAKIMQMRQMSTLSPKLSRTGMTGISPMARTMHLAAVSPKGRFAGTYVLERPLNQPYAMSPPVQRRKPKIPGKRLSQPSAYQAFASKQLDAHSRNVQPDSPSGPQSLRTVENAKASEDIEEPSKDSFLQKISKNEMLAHVDLRTRLPGEKVKRVPVSPVDFPMHGAAPRSNLAKRTPAVESMLKKKI